MDLVRYTRLAVPSSLNRQTIINLSHNGVTADIFEKLMEEDLEEKINPLLDWDGPDANVRLAKVVERIGRCKGTRRIRCAGADARLFNYQLEDNDEVDEDSDIDGGNSDDDDDDKRDEDTDEFYVDSIANGTTWERRANGELVEREDISGAPVLIHESTRQMLLAGFSPEEPVVRQNISQMVKQTIKNHHEKCHIPIKQSVEAFVAAGEATAANCLVTLS